MEERAKPRIAIVCRGCGEGGSVASVALRHARELAAAFDVVLLSDSFPAEQPSGVAFVKIASKRYDFLRRFAHVPNEQSFVRAACHAVAQLAPRPDLVIAHSHAVAARLEGFPSALVTHGDIFDRPRGTYDPWLTRLYRRVEPIAYRRAGFVIAISPAMAASAVKHGARAEDVELVPNGIDFDELPEMRREPHDGPLRLLYVGRLSVEKGVDILLDACAILRGRGVPFHLDIVGGGPLAQTLRKQDLGVIHGHRDRHEVKAFLAAADLVCVPSRSESQGIVVLEALASGVPVVASAVGGIPAMVRDGVNGILVPPDPARFAEVITRLAADRETLQAMSRAARQSVAGFSWDAIGKRLREVVWRRIAA